MHIKLFFKKITKAGKSIEFIKINFTPSKRKILFNVENNFHFAIEIALIINLKKIYSFIEISRCMCIGRK
jgi:hypothetical protein